MTLEVILTGKDVKAGKLTSRDDGASPPTLSFEQFPDDTRIGTLTVNTNIRRLYSLGDRYMKDAIVQKFEGSVGIDMPLYDKNFLSDLLTSVPFGDLVIQYPSFVRVLNDFVPQRVEVSIREDELVRVSADGVFAKEEELTGYDVSSTEPSAVYPTHINASITDVDGVTNVKVRSATIRVNLNNELKWGLHSRFAKAVVPKQIEVETTIEAIIDKSMLDKILADTQTAVDITLTVSVGETTMTIKVEGAYLDSVAEPIEPNTEVYATLTYIGKKVVVS